jgi:hypothetical protein
MAVPRPETATPGRFKATTRRLPVAHGGRGPFPPVGPRRNIPRTVDGRQQRSSQTGSGWDESTAAQSGVSLRSAILYHISERRR